MKVFSRLQIIADEKQDRADYLEEYWALRKRFNIKDGSSLEPLNEDQKKFFREQIKKLKKKYHQEKTS